MKTRIGFVSNSSSTSFCIYGVCVDYKKAIEKLNNGKECYSLPLPNGFCSYQNPNYDDDFYIGKEWYTIGDNQTGLEFKKNIQEELSKLFGEPIKCETLADSWYDG